MLKIALPNCQLLEDISEAVYTIPGKLFVYLKNFTELYNEAVGKRDDCNQWFGYQ
ncbi:hypothetical protein [Phocaeicola sp.]|uniref:hypothetical protein n=1 Tax=Phocaeicola sp. TaxID=2773926 RepID=UPI0023D2F498|nr:hypothetical protein [Phocaeicola sp.]MDE5676252.1 hypothetical protein [Phocaeicola sp.]